MVQRVVVDSNRLPQTAINQLLLKLRLRIVEHIRKYVCGVCRFRILSDARTLPLNLNGYRSHWSFDDEPFAFLERWNRWNRVSHEWIGAPLPLAQLSFHHGENRCRIDVSGNDQGGVIRNVILVLDGTHLLRRSGRNYLPVTDDILSAETARIDFGCHLAVETEKRARLVSVVFPDNYLALALQLIGSEQRTANR